MLPNALRHRHVSVSCFFVGTLCIILACGVIASHVQTFGVKRDTAVLIGTSLPKLRTSVALLRSTVEAEELFARQARSAREEQASAYILPGGSPVPRAVLTLEQLSLALRDASQGQFSLQSLTFASTSENRGTHKTLDGTAILRGSFQDVARLLGVLSIGGDMMVRDALMPGVEEQFLHIIGTDQPLALRAAQDFLYLDLLEYALSPDIAEQGALSGVSDAVRPDLRQMLLQGGLAEVRSALGPVATRLKERNVWPTPLIQVTSLKRQESQFTVGLRLLSR
jgi:hypothetical protein